MAPRILGAVALGVLLTACAGSAIEQRVKSQGTAQDRAGKPSVIIFTMVDDLGWSDVGFHFPANPEIRTPNMDSLVSQGVNLTRHYVHYTCTPSRSSFLSGRLPVHVQMTLDNPEQPNSGIPRNMTTLPAKMKQAGYSTAVVGKWDAGMATYTHTPEGRGFDQSLIYFEHKNDYWNQQLFQSSCQDVDPTIVDLWSNGAPAYGLNGTAYEPYMMRQRVLDIINAHDVDKDGPLFLYFAPHAAHCPLMIPPDVLANFSGFADDEAACKAQTPYIFPGSTDSDYHCRGQYEALVWLADQDMGAIADAVRAKGWWNDTLWVLSSDNGAPLDVQESGGNNSPLKGGKYSSWEGGVRSTAFLSGGWLPASMRGTSSDVPVHVADWYTTLSTLAGVPNPTADPVAAAAGLPPVDSLDVWPALVAGNASLSPRQEIPIDASSLIQGRYKFLRGPQQLAGWTGDVYPNASSVTQSLPTAKCGSGCLFDVVADVTEHTDIAAAHPDIVAAMSARLDQLAKGFFSNNDTGVDVCPPGIKIPCACWVALNKNKHFFGPYQY